MMLPIRSRSGFTLIELMATLVIAMILITVGLVSYIGFQERYEAERVAQELQRFFVQARARSRSLDQEGCSSGSVVGYRTQYIPGASPQGSTYGWCGTGKYSAAPGDTVATYTSPSNSAVVTINGTTTVFSITFYSYPVYGGAMIEYNSSQHSSGEIRVSNGGATYSFTVGSAGEISAVTRL